MYRAVSPAETLTVAGLELPAGPHKVTCTTPDGKVRDGRGAAGGAVDGDVAPAARRADVQLPAPCRLRGRRAPSRDRAAVARLGELLQRHLELFGLEGRSRERDRRLGVPRGDDRELVGDARGDAIDACASGGLAVDREDGVGDAVGRHLDVDDDRALLQLHRDVARLAVLQRELLPGVLEAVHRQLHVERDAGRKILDRRRRDLGAKVTVDPDGRAGRLARHGDRALRDRGDGGCGRLRLRRIGLLLGEDVARAAERARDDEHAGDQPADEQAVRLAGSVRVDVRDRARGRGRGERAGDALTARVDVEPAGEVGVRRRRRVLQLDDVREVLALQKGFLLHRQLLLEERLHELVEIEARDGDLVVADEGLEVGLHLACALVAIPHVLGEGAHHDALEVRRVVGANLARPGVLALADQLERLVLALSLEEALSGRELEEHRPGREQIAPRVERLSARLLRGHVRDLALELAALRLLADARVALGDAEVDDLHVTRERHDDVLRGDVPVDDPEVRAVEIALVVRVREAGAHAEHDREGVLERELEDALLLHLTHDGAEVLSVDVLHRDEVLTVRLPDVEDLDDVRVRERRRDARLVQQHLDERAVLVHGRQDPLDDEQLLEAGDALLDGEEQLRHPARRELANEGVLAEPGRHPLHPQIAIVAAGPDRRGHQGCRLL